MKRSRTAALLLMGTAPLMLTSCSDEATTREGLYTSIDACVAQTDDRPACERAMGEARKQAEVEAPRYATREECIAAHGAEQCDERRDANGHSFFMPFMTGFLMAQMMRGGQPAGLAASPAFRDRAGNWQRPGPAAAGGVYRAGTTRAMAPIGLQPDRAPTVTRGGFGSSNSGRGASS